MPDPNHNHEPRGWPRPLAGTLLLALLLFTLMALLTYDWRDINILQDPPNTPILGVAGAWCAFLGYRFFGFAVWLVPCWMLMMAVALLSPPRGRLAWRNAGYVIFLLAASTLFALLPETWLSGAAGRLNIAGGRGGVGEVFAEWLKGWFGNLGAWMATLALLFAGLALALGARNLARMRDLVFPSGREKEPEETPVKKQAEPEPEPAPEPKPAGFWSRLLRRVIPDAVDDEETPAPKPAPKPPPETPAEREQRRQEDLRKRVKEVRDAAQRERGAPRPRNPQPPRRAPAQDAPPAAPRAQYDMPTVELLDPIPTTKADHGDVETTGALIVQTLQEFGLQTELTGVERGPVVTQYQLLPAMGIRVEKIASLAATLQLVLKATGLRVQTPVPGKGVVGIEVPNKVAQPVTLREVCSSEMWRANRMEIPLALGKDVSGRDLLFDLTQAPHLLVAGASGSGKSVGLNAILAGLLLTRKPDELRLMLVDPKRVEFSAYNDIPHLLVPVITDPKKVAFGLRWLIMEMDRRYKILQKARVRNISTFNIRPEASQIQLELDRGGPAPDPFAPPAKLPYIVIVIDEMADLMLTVGKEIEESITRLAALSRAVGIHMIIATQRPSVNVITGTIKANFPGRISFKVAQRNDSRTILDGQGAEALIGHGDMLFLNPKNSRLLRAQGAWISEDEVHRLTEHCRSQAKPAFDVGLVHRMDKIQETKPEEILGLEEEEKPAAPSGPAAGGDEEEGDEKTIRDAIQVLRDTRRASTSSLQRRLRLGYNRAARIMDMLEERGIVGPSRGADPREILIDLEGEIPAHISEVIHQNNDAEDDGDDPDFNDGLEDEDDANEDPDEEQET
ncbi:MAG: DNA translocase FtsK [Kiritimatiellaeota bacterium]|nr:DNA translocase FtsK [Kiritimatiellota bacterium]